MSFCSNRYVFFSSSCPFLLFYQPNSLASKGAKNGASIPFVVVGTKNDLCDRENDGGCRVEKGILDFCKKNSFPYFATRYFPLFSLLFKLKLN